ncbi:MAG: amidohydrolase [Pseudomonadota bacterium]
MDRLRPTDLTALVALRHDLHRHPEVSGQEEATAHRIADTLSAMGVDQIVTGLGGHGVAAVIASGVPGPTVLLRCELDALPIQETGTSAHHSVVSGRAHLCGHDGHMATVLGAGRMLLRRRPARGRVVLMFQPAEEDGTGAIAVCDDPAFAALAPDWAFALHNMPDIKKGTAHVPVGLSSAPSVGLTLAFAGVEAHACAPETGISPGAAMASLLTGLPALSQGAFPAPDFRLVTVTHAQLGRPTFGIAPGQGTVFATCRTASDATLSALIGDARASAEDTARAHGLTLTVAEADRFLAGVNDPHAAALLQGASDAVGLVTVPGLPLRASEDFGRFGHDCRAAMLLLGAGPGPALHNPDYDFDDDLIGPGAAVLVHAARAALSR